MSTLTITLDSMGNPLDAERITTFSTTLADVTCDAYVEAFRFALLSMGFHSNSIARALAGCADEHPDV